MIQKLKNWLIKKLGGYTKAEYDSRRYIVPFTMRENLEYITICEEREVEEIAWRHIPGEIKLTLARRLGAYAEKYMEFDVSDTPNCDRVIVRAMLNVVKKG